jgi:phosphatidylinositol glycan class V
MRSIYTNRDQLLALFGLFIAWKGLILLIVFSSPGIGYDTSASLSGKTGNELILDETPMHFSSQWLKFVRWDAIYFTHMAQQGHIFEQEWAFGVGLSSSLSFLAKRKTIPMTPEQLRCGAYSL